MSNKKLSQIAVAINTGHGSELKNLTGIDLQNMNFAQYIETNYQPEKTFSDANFYDCNNEHGFVVVVTYDTIYKDWCCNNQRLKGVPVIFKLDCEFEDGIGYIMPYYEIFGDCVAWDDDTSADGRMVGGIYTNMPQELKWRMLRLYGLFGMYGDLHYGRTPNQHGAIDHLVLSQLAEWCAEGTPFSEIWSTFYTAYRHLSQYSAIAIDCLPCNVAYDGDTDNVILLDIIATIEED